MKDRRLSKAWEENSEVTRVAFLIQYVQILYTYRSGFQELSAVSGETALPTTLVCSNGNELIILVKGKMCEIAHGDQRCCCRKGFSGNEALVYISLDCHVQTAMCQICLDSNSETGSVSGSSPFISKELLMGYLTLRRFGLQRERGKKCLSAYLTPLSI